jgi:hypothetical protein
MVASLIGVPRPHIQSLTASRRSWPEILHRRSSRFRERQGGSAGPRLPDPVDLVVAAVLALLMTFIGKISFAGRCREGCDPWERVVALLVRQMLSLGDWLATNEERLVGVDYGPFSLGASKMDWYVGCTSDVRNMATSSATIAVASREPRHALHRSGTR